MRRAICFALFTLFLTPVLQNPGFAAKAEKSERITVSGAFALYPLMVTWAEEFKKAHPDVTIDVSAGGAGKGMADVISGLVDIGMISRKITEAEVKKGVFFLAVAKDAVIATMNVNNPAAPIIQQRGLKREELISIWMTQKLSKWGDLTANKATGNIRAYIRADSCGAAETWSQFLGGKAQEELKGIGVFGDPGIATAVQNDKFGIGFNNVAFGYDFETGKPQKNLMIIPIDVNGNGKLDPKENFYENRGLLVKAIADGRYPSPPTRDLFLITANKSMKPGVKRFLNFILSEGQKLVSKAGYVQLRGDSIKDGIRKLNE